jgi:D-glycero-D-manno-heptose 1,7-bisphosphate phosphatase
VALSRGVFVDKDGTLVEDVPYSADPDLLRPTQGAGPALGRLHRAGYRIVVVSNQSGVARGRFPVEALDAVGERLRSLLAPHGVPLAGLYWCPHHPEGLVPRYAVTCECRKPAPGLVLRAAQDLGLDLARSWMVGDILDDVEAGHRAGCRSLLLDRGGETEWRLSPERVPDAVAGDLGEAAALILARDEARAEAVR